MFRAALLLALSVVLLAASPARADLTVTGHADAQSAVDAVHGDERCARALDEHPRAAARRVRRGAERRYPVLLLLHGCCDDYRSWVDKGRAEQLTAPYPLIVVMPDGGSAGWYSDPDNAARRPAALRDLRVRRAAAVGGRDVPLDRPSARSRA